VPAQYGPEKTNNYEIGTKADFLDRTFSVDASVYYIEFRDIQLGFINSTTDVSYTANVGSAKSQGVELSVESRPARGLRLAAWVVFSDAVLTEIPPGVTLTGIIASPGDSLPDSSRFSGNVSVDQEFPLSGAITGFVGATESYLGQREGAYGNINGIYGTQRFVSPAYARTDLRAGAKYDSWTANLYINNATDRRGLISGDDQDAFANIRYIIQPRTIGLSVAKAF